MKIKLSFIFVLAVLSLFALFAGCASQPKSVSMKYQPRPEESIFLNKCGSCHLLPKIESQTKEGWDAVIQKHEEKRVHLSDSERTMLVKYLKSKT